MKDMYPSSDMKLNNKKNFKKWAKHLNRCFTKKSSWMANKHMKTCSTALSAGTCKLKPQ